MIRTIYIFWSCQFLWWSLGQSVPSDEFVCVPGLLTWGATSPKGDIMLEAGSTLEVNCTIDLTHGKVKGRTAKDIKFSLNKHEISDELIEKTVLNESTAMLRILNMNVSTPVVNCYFDNDTPICENQVDVGYPPLPVENLKCVARNWASLNCTWDKPLNNILTTYNFSYAFREYLVYCPNQIALSKTTESCEWNGRTEPHYRQNMRIITIVITGTNYLNPGGVRWKYQFNNLEIVIPSAPSRLQVEALSPNQISVRWSFHHFQLFGPGLNHQITVCPVEPIHDCLVKDLKSIHIANLTERISLPYAYTKYKVEVRMKSQVANDTPEFWSPPAIRPSVETLPKRPESPPTVGIGTFEVFNKYQLRDVTLYWKRLPHYLQNGSNFHYKFTVFEDHQQRRDIVPQVKAGVEYAFFGNLTLNSYRFEIQAVNSLGESEEKASLYVPKTTVGEPQSVSKVDYANGTYEISWQPPLTGTSSPLSSYTVYRCHGNKVICEELVEWIDVDPGKTHYIFEKLEITGVNHVFAVSANTQSASSGMVMATCELIHNKIPGKLKQVRGGSVATENSLEIRWGMDCSFKPGLVTAFRVTFCNPLDNFTCADPSSARDIIVPGNVTSWILDNLEAYTSYVIWVSMVTQAGESQTSDPLSLKTNEAAPSDPPWVTALTQTNTSVQLKIQSPIKSNGVVTRYEISYNPTSSSADPVNTPRVKILQVKALLEHGIGEYRYILTDLEPNTNYTLSVAACTVSCSNFSESLYFQTKFGYTTLTSMPALTYEDGRILVSWNAPKHIGGPIKYYEVLVQKNGQLAEPLTIDYDPDRTTYLEEMDLKCESSTNITARVRAITSIGSEVLFGNWSPEGSLNCYANAVWFIWILIVIATIICIILMSFISVKFWRKVKVMITLDLISPPGLEQLELSGISGRRVQKSSNDCQRFGNDSLICSTTGYQSADMEDIKDFMRAESKENEPRGEERLDMDVLQGMNPSLGENIVVANGKALDKSSSWLWNPRLTLPQEDTHSLPPNIPLNNINTLNQPSLLGLQPPNSDGLLDKGASPSPSNPLMSDNSATNSAEEDGEDLEHYRQLNFAPYGSLSLYNGNPHYDNGEIHMANGYHRDPTQDPESYGTGSSLPCVSNGTIPNPSIPEPTKESAYVKWTSLKLDPMMGNGKTPYCQVGILLEQ